MSSFSFIGSQLLGFALPAAFFSAVLYGVGYRKAYPPLIRSAQRATVLTFILISLAAITLIAAFLNNDYSILYVYSYSNASLPFFYKITGLWAGLDGSLLFWTWLVSLYALIVLEKNKFKNADWMPWINGVMMTVILFFLSLILFANNPFTPMEMPAADGKGLNPLLQNIAMIIHPPMLYLGFTGFTVPFAFMIAALGTKRLDTSWIEDSRRWTIIAWLFLSLGLLLGGAWAYVELGWGGFWAWDPVENAALMPWLTGTAYLHSVIVQKRRGMLLLWNTVLIGLTFLLTIFGTYLTRSGVVQSVHAFSESNLGPFFLGFMAFIFIATFILIATRLPYLKSENVLQSFFSRETAFLLNNVLFLVATFAVLWGTMFPTLSELVTDNRITVGAPFFNQMMAPVGLGILLLMGIGPMISWKKATLSNLKMNLLFPYLFGAIVAITFAAFGITQWYVLSSVFLIAAVFGTLYLEFYRGIRAVRKQKKLNVPSAFMELLITSNRRYGGYVVHVGVLLLFIGIAGAVFKTEADFTSRPGETFHFKGYDFKYVQPRIQEDEHKTDLTAVLELSRKGKLLKTLYPAKYFYRSAEQPSTEVDLYQTLLGDVYVIIGSLAPQTGKAEFRVTINPLISFMWFGGFVLLLGVVILILPKAIKVKPGVPAAMLLFVLLSGAHGSLRAEEAAHDHDDHAGHAHVTDATSSIENMDPEAPETKRLKEVGDRLICQCGGCVRESLKTCTCTFAKQEREKILALMRDNNSDDQILKAFTDQYGLQALSSPPREGFFNIGYRLPIALFILGVLVGLVFVLVWLKKFRSIPKVRADAKPSPESDAYAERLARELKEMQ